MEDEFESKMNLENRAVQVMVTYSFYVESNCLKKGRTEEE